MINDDEIDYNEEPYFYCIECNEKECYSPDLMCCYCYTLNSK